MSRTHNRRACYNQYAYQPIHHIGTDLACLASIVPTQHGALVGTVRAISKMYANPARRPCWHGSCMLSKYHATLRRHGSCILATSMPTHVGTDLASVSASVARSMPKQSGTDLARGLFYKPYTPNGSRGGLAPRGPHKPAVHINRRFL